MSAVARPALPPALWSIIAICTVIEAVLALGDLGIPGPAGLLRAEAIAFAGFQPALLGSGREIWAGQSAAMFLTYGFLHGDSWHWAVNMATLLALGGNLAPRLGQAAFLGLYLLSMLGGAVCYALIGPPDVPMVGASGALFGLAGTYIGREIVTARRARRSPWPSYRLIVLLVVLNAVLWWLAAGRLAWQAHLGGALAGLGLALARPPWRP